jgi:hypothetical protein
MVFEGYGFHFVPIEASGDDVLMISSAHGGGVFFTFCPTTPAVESEVKWPISTVCGLLPFIPQVVVLPAEWFLGAVEILSSGGSYFTFMHQFTTAAPRPCNLTWRILEFVSGQTEKLNLAIGLQLCVRV